MPARNKRIQSLQHLLDVVLPSLNCSKLGKPWVLNGEQLLWAPCTTVPRRFPVKQAFLPLFMGVPDRGKKSAISSAGSPQHSGQGLCCSPWFTWQLFCIALASDLVRVCLGRFLWGWEQQNSSGRFPPPAAVPPLPGMRCLLWKPKTSALSEPTWFPLEAAKPAWHLRMKVPY